MHASVKGAALAASAGLFWGTIGAAQTLLPAGISPLALGTVRILLGAAAFFILLAGQVTWRHIDWKPRHILLGAVGIAGLQVGLFSALPKIGVAMGTMVTIGSSPVVAGLLGKLIYREQLSQKWYAATALAIGGCGLLILPGGEAQVNLEGVAWALLGGCSYALCGLGVKGMASSPSLIPNLAALILLAGILLGIGSAGSDFSWALTPSGLAVSLYLGLVTTVLPYWLFARSLHYIPLAQTYTYGLTEPLTAFLLGVFVLREALSTGALAGVVILLIGLCWLALPEKN
jgi:DME family drug/metabolite transporter